jgi:hypothetical protein
MMTKPTQQSKTLWFNILTGLSLFFALPELLDVLPAESVRWLLLAQAGINILLRLLTNTGLTVAGVPTTVPEGEDQ